ncbi:MAG: transposase [Prevotellaceae bacterium]|nr:transposase [Prevotellaceae bacterium]
MVEFYDDEKDVSALEIAHLYKNRWQIEVFFKWIKQNLIVKKLWGQLRKCSKYPYLGGYLHISDSRARQAFA